MQSMLQILYQKAGRDAPHPSVELDTVWQMIDELEQRTPNEVEALRTVQEGILSSVKRAEMDGFTAGFRCAAALWRECV